jgi:ankyrin repeat protein
LGIAHILLEHGADVNAPAAEWEGRTALEGAAEHGRIDMLKLLINAGAKITGPGENQYVRALKFAKDNWQTGTRGLLEELALLRTE